MSQLWIGVVVLVSIYCAIQAVRDFRRGDRLMGAVGAACVVALWLVPIQAQAVKFDLVAVSAG